MRGGRVHLKKDFPGYFFRKSLKNQKYAIKKKKKEQRDNEDNFYHQKIISVSNIRNNFISKKNFSTNFLQFLENFCTLDLICKWKKLNLGVVEVISQAL